MYFDGSPGATPASQNSIRLTPSCPENSVHECEGAESERFVESTSTSVRGPPRCGRSTESALFWWRAQGHTRRKCEIEVIFGVSWPSGPVEGTHQAVLKL